jgi:hypothetical protein
MRYSYLFKNKLEILPKMQLCGKKIVVKMEFSCGWSILVLLFLHIFLNMTGLPRTYLLCRFLHFRYICSVQVVCHICSWTTLPSPPFSTRRLSLLHLERHRKKNAKGKQASPFSACWCVDYSTIRQANRVYQHFPWPVPLGKAGQKIVKALTVR